MVYYRSQLSDLQDELDAVQSQAYLLMLEQEKELTAGSRVLEETWEQLVTLVKTYKDYVKVQEEVSLVTPPPPPFTNNETCPVG